MTRRSRVTTAYFDGGYVTIHEPDAGPVVVEVHGYADRTSTPSHAGDGPVVVEIRRTRLPT